MLDAEGKKRAIGTAKYPSWQVSKTLGVLFVVCFFFFLFKKQQKTRGASQFGWDIGCACIRSDAKHPLWNSVVLVSGLHPEREQQ